MIAVDPSNPPQIKISFIELATPKSMRDFGIGATKFCLPSVTQNELTFTLVHPPIINSWSVHKERSNLIQVAGLHSSGRLLSQKTPLNSHFEKNIKKGEITTKVSRHAEITF